jgi:carboxymethylenebutenolidase
LGKTVTLTASDGHKFSAYRADPAGKPRGGIVVIQEIFGVNEHIRRVTDGFAADGYTAIAPALFDRIKPNFDVGYSEGDIMVGREMKGKSDTDAALRDIAAARNAIKPAGKLGVVGYCWGGFLAWLAATRLDGFSGASSYYGGGIGSVATERPKCPAIMHFGEKDHAIPMAEVDKVREAQKGRKVEIHIYPSGHGFNCDQRGSYDAGSARMARERTLDFFKQYISTEHPQPAGAKR